MSLDSLVGTDVVLARKVLDMDDRIDEANRDMFRHVRDALVENKEDVDRGIQAISISRNLERIGDLATNIAEDVIFMVEGELVRHPSLY
jgi:phosphate transport system protein